jgi:hypothetical protein
MSPEWMEDNVPITVRGWEEEDEALADKQEELKGFWLLSPEKRERTVRLFWVSPFLYSYPADKPFLHAWFHCVAASIGVFLAAALNAGSSGEWPRSRAAIAWKWSPWQTSVINPHWRSSIIEAAALAHLGERQTEVHFMSSIQCVFWRYCVRSTEAASIIIF